MRFIGEKGIARCAVTPEQSEQGHRMDAHAIPVDGAEIGELTEQESPMGARTVPVDGAESGKLTEQESPTDTRAVPAPALSGRQPISAQHHADDSGKQRNPALRGV